MGTGFDYRQVGDRLWPVLRQVMKGHTVVYRATHGLVGHRFPGAPSTLLLDHVGARSGKTRTTPLTYLRDGENFVLVASKGGYPRNPSWYHNLRANPQATIVLDGISRAVAARELSGDERERGYRRGEEIFPGFTHYRRWASNRQIPVLRLEPLR